MAIELNLSAIEIAHDDTPFLAIEEFVVNAGSVVVISGASGSGKSTLLEVVAGVIQPDSGQVLWDGVDIHKAGRVVRLEFEKQSSIVFQEHALISYLPLFENVALPLRHHRTFPREEISQRVEKLLASLELEAVAWHLPEALSVGQRRLASIARAFLVIPRLICMDEPTEGLDEAQRSAFINYFENYRAEQKCTVVITSNNDYFLSHYKESTIDMSGISIL